MLIPFRLIIKFQNMSKKEIIAFVLKIVVAICVAVGAVIGVNVLSSCSAYKNASAFGRTTVVTVDTTNIDHSAGFSLEIKKR